MTNTQTTRIERKIKLTSYIFSAVPRGGQIGGTGVGAGRGAGLSLYVGDSYSGAVSPVIL
jgi:hypothetical protein